MDIFLTVIAAIVIFSVLVLVHEYGHFIAARRAGIRVVEFGIGFPPRLFKKKIGETVYTINAIPFGGFVKLYGEDATDPKILKDPHSFAHKSPWVRTQVVVAGVLMNFLLAIVLLTIGFSFGIKPWIVSREDLIKNIKEGNVIVAPGAYVSKVTPELAALGLSVGDELIAFNSKPLTSAEDLAVFQKGTVEKEADLVIQTKKDRVIKNLHLTPRIETKDFGLEVNSYTNLPRLTVLSVRSESPLAQAGLRVGDVPYSIDGKPIYNEDDFQEVLATQGAHSLVLMRGVNMTTLIVNRPLTFTPQYASRVVIADVMADSVAQRVGLRKGDILLAINEKTIKTPQEALTAISVGKGRQFHIDLMRFGSQLSLKPMVAKEDKLGIALAATVSFNSDELIVYPDLLLSSILEMHKVKYPVIKAFTSAVSESVRLTGMTFGALGKMVKSLIADRSVPSDIGGPVQIISYTHTFVQEGFFALIRFAALLSLSLAVMNILPIPALDGGRFLFIIIEVVTRKRVSARIESTIHIIGFLLLMALIALITISDISKLAF